MDKGLPLEGEEEVGGGEEEGDTAIVPTNDDDVRGGGGGLVVGLAVLDRECDPLNLLLCCFDSIDVSARSFIASIVSSRKTEPLGVMPAFTSVSTTAVISRIGGEDGEGGGRRGIGECPR